MKQIKYLCIRLYSIITWLKFGSDECYFAVKQGLPSHFCKTHLPSRDTTISLVDENDEVSETKYLALKTGLSGGWRGFAIDHELVDGDALVFQLTEPTSFKVTPTLFGLVTCSCC